MLRRWHLYFGLALLLASLIGLMAHNFWWEQYYFAFAWLGWVFFVDALSFGRWKSSLFSRLGHRAIALFILSVPFWLTYSLINLHLQLWTTGHLHSTFESDFFYGISHSAVLPGILVTANFFLPSFAPFIPDQRLSFSATVSWASVGVASLALALFAGALFFPLMFCFLALILDPINYYSARPSVLFALRSLRLRPLVGFCVSALVIGLFWESLNGITGGGWSYRLPYLNFDAVFAMPLFGLLGYIPFAASAFAFVVWFESLLGKEPLFPH